MEKRKSSKILGVILACLVIASAFGAFPSITRAAGKFNIGDTVEVTANLNVRTGPGTSYAEISDPDYPGYAPQGTIGKVLGGPSSADGYIWWQVDFGPGLYSGWSVEGGLQKVSQPPPPPTPTSPGSSSSPGPVINTLTPTFYWSGVSGADYYGLYIRNLETNTLVFDSQVRGIQITGTSYTLPSGVLEWGKPYRWNMNSHNSAGWGNYSGVLYFQTKEQVQPPTVETSSATDITQTAATINGRIVSDGGSSIIERRFDWGTTSSCSDGWAASVSVSGSYFSYRLTGLNPGTTYYFRAWAKNSAGWSQGSVLSFTTQAGDVTLTLYVHEGSASGPVIPGARVTGQDAAGNSFDKTTNSSGYVTITGTPGTWSFTASKSGYQTNSWSQSITSTSTKHAYLEVSPPTTAPTHLSPANGASDVSTRPTFQWQAVSGATKYGLYVSKPPYGAANLVFDSEVDYGPITGTSLTLPITLEEGVTYRWNMRAGNDASWGPFSSSWSFTTATATVTLTLYVHEGSASGPVIPGARVTGQDAAGNSFDKTTNSSGYVTITGTPGTWSFTASKSGYQTNSWSQSIASTTTKHAYLVKVVQKPSPPTPAWPGSSSSPSPTIDTLTPTLQWSGVSDADYYALAISKYPYGSTNIVYNPQQLYGTSHTVPSGKLEYGQKYRWNMQAYNSAGWSDVSITLYFQTEVGLLPAPSLSSPSNYDTDVSTTPTFSWSAVSGASSYRIMVGTSYSGLPTDPTASTGSGLVINSTTTSTWYTPSSGVLSEGTTYYWEVHARSSTKYGEWSSKWSFTTGTTFLSAPSLSSPSNYDTDVSTTLTFSWSAVSGASSYRIMVGTSYSGLPTDPTASTGLGLVINATTTSTWYTPSSGMLSEGTTYYWEVHARSSTKYGEWSSKWSFTTAGDKTSPAIVSTSPSNGDIGVIVTTMISVTFSEAMDRDSAEGAFSISLDVSGSFGWSDNAMTFVPDANLAYETTFTVAIGIAAQDLVGNNLKSPYSWDFTTESPRISPLNAPSDLTATVVSSSQINLSWSDNSNNEAGFSVERKIEGGTYGQIDTVGPNVTSYSDTSLTVNTTYCYRVRAYNDIGDSNYSNEAFATTLTSISDQQKQQEILNMVNNHWGSVPAELVLAIIRTEAGEGAFHVDSWNYNTFYEDHGSWSQPTNGDGIMQVSATGNPYYHERSGSYTHNRGGYDHAIKDGCDYLSEHYDTYGSYAQATLHYNTGPNSLYIYLGKDWGNRNYLSLVAGYLSNFVPDMYGLQNQNLVDALNQGQTILNDYLYNKGIATEQSVDYYRQYQMKLDTDLRNIGLKGAIKVTSTPSGASFSLSGQVNYTGTTPWSTTDAPLGTYTIIWGSMSGYTTPPSETKTLTQGVTISFSGIYSSEPMIASSPSGLFFISIQGGDDPSSQILRIWNSGTGSLDWEVSSDAKWLNTSPTSGSSTGETDRVSLSVNIAGMEAGDYKGVVTISATGATNISRIVPVSLSISPEPTTIKLPDLTVTSVKVPSKGTVGEDMSVTFTVINQGKGSSGRFHGIVSLSVRPERYGTDVYLGDFAVDSIAAGDSQKIAVEVSIPASIPSVGEYYVTVFADSLQKVSESNDDNNIGSSYPGTITIASETTTLADLITHNAIGGVPVTVDGQHYFILTLKNRIDPINLEVVPDSGTTKVYVDAENRPVSEEEVVVRIGLIELARKMQAGAGSPNSISQALQLMEDRWATHEKMDLLRAVWEVLPTTWSSAAAEALKELLPEIAKAIEDEIFKPQAEVRQMAYDDFFAAKAKYQLAWQLAQGSKIEDSEEATQYLEHLFTAQALHKLSFSLLDKIDEVQKGTINRLAEKGVEEVTFGLYDIIEPAKTKADAILWANEYEEAKKREFSQISRQLSSYFTKPVIYTLELAQIPRIELQVHSPVELRVYDSQGRITGIVNGEKRNEIPYSVYYENTVTIFSPTDTYNSEIAGTSKGSYELTVTRAIGQEVNKFSTAQILTSVGAVHLLTIDWDALSRQRDKLPIRVDSDGDGRFEDIVYLSGPGARGLPPWVWLVIGVVIGFAIAFGVWRRMGKKQVAKR